MMLTHNEGGCLGGSLVHGKEPGHNPSERERCSYTAAPRAALTSPLRGAELGQPAGIHGFTNRSPTATVFTCARVG